MRNKKPSRLCTDTALLDLKSGGEAPLHCGEFLVSLRLLTSEYYSRGILADPLRSDTPAPGHISVQNDNNKNTRLLKSTHHNQAVFLSYYGLDYTCKSGKTERLGAIKRSVLNLFPKICATWNLIPRFYQILPNFYEGAGCSKSTNPNQDLPLLQYQKRNYQAKLCRRTCFSIYCVPATG